MRRIILTLSLLLASTAGAQWRIYTGGYSTAWHTTGGHHGHDVDCPPEEQHDRCESHDFARANLDNSVGFRLGAEQRQAWLGRVDLVYGAELNVDSTEYNITQRDFYIGSGLATGGAVADFLYITWGVRAGVGIAASDDGHFGGVYMAEGSADVPLNRTVALRLGHRETGYVMSGESLRLRDHAVLLVFTDTPAESQWRIRAEVGVSSPGLLFGDDLDLSRAPFTKLTALRRMNDRSALGISYLAAAHESRNKSDFMGFPDNERGKTINGFAVDWTTEIRTTPRWFVELGAGVEIADWADEHELLPEPGGIEFAPMVKVTAGFPLTPNLAFVATSEHLYWAGTSLGESRLAIGISSR